MTNKERKKRTKCGGEGGRHLIHAHPCSPLSCPPTQYACVVECIRRESRGPRVGLDQPMDAALSSLPLFRGETSTRAKEFSAWRVACVHVFAYRCDCSIDEC